MDAHKCLCLALIGCLVAAALGQDNATFNQPGNQITFLGKSAKFEITTGSGTMKVSFGSIQELDSSGNAVNGRKIVELASLSPIFEQGSILASDGTNVSYVRLHQPLNSTGLTYTTSSCASPLVTQSDFQAGFVDIIFYFGFSNSTEFAYGFNNTLVAPGNSNKFSLSAANWPFCASGNTLQVTLSLGTGAGQNAKPKQSTFAGTEAELSGSSGTGGTRRMLQASARHEGSNGNTGGPHASMMSVNAVVGGAVGSKRPTRDPRVAGHQTHQIALLMSSSLAATLDLETYAYDSANGTTIYNVTTSMASQGANTLVQLVFPTFTTIYYDPTLATGVSATSAGYTSASATSAAAASTRSGVMAGLAGVLLMLVLM